MSQPPRYGTRVASECHYRLQAQGKNDFYTPFSPSMPRVYPLLLLSSDSHAWCPFAMWTLVTMLRRRGEKGTTFSVPVQVSSGGEQGTTLTRQG